MTNKVSSNSALVEWPQDKWGFTSELRKTGLRTVARVRGDDVKMALLMETFRILIQHAQARLPEDKAALSRRIEENGIRAQAEVPNNQTVKE